MVQIVCPLLPPQSDLLDVEMWWYKACHWRLFPPSFLESARNLILLRAGKGTILYLSCTLIHSILFANSTNVNQLNFLFCTDSAMSMPGLASSTANLVSLDSILQVHHCCKLGLAQTKSIAIGLKTCKQAKAFFGPKYRDYCHLDCPERLLKIFLKHPPAWVAPFISVMLRFYTKQSFMFFISLGSGLVMQLV